MPSLMPAVKISEEHDKMLENELDRIKDESGIRGSKKELVEKCIENTLNEI